MDAGLEYAEKAIQNCNIEKVVHYFHSLMTEFTDSKQLFIQLGIDSLHEKRLEKCRTNFREAVQHRIRFRHARNVRSEPRQLLLHAWRK